MKIPVVKRPREGVSHGSVSDNEARDSYECKQKLQFHGWPPRRTIDDLYSSAMLGPVGSSGGISGIAFL